MMRAFTRASLGILFFSAAALAAGIKFEVASVKPVLNWPPAGGGTGERGTGGGCPTSMKIDPERVDFKCTTVAMLIGYAFRLSPDRITGPDWMMGVGQPRFNIVAKIPQGASKNQVPEMFQALLAERFKLVIHRGTGNLPMYTLVVAKGGLKVRPAAPEAGAQVPAADPDARPSLDGFYGSIQSRTIPSTDGNDSVTVISNPRMGMVRQSGDPFKVQRWQASNISFAGLADLLDHVVPLSSPVIDMTGVKGRYELVLEVSLRELPGMRRTSSAAGESPAADNLIADRNDAVLKGFNDGLLKLGLRLEFRRGPLETLVVDRVEKTPTEN